MSLMLMYVCKFTGFHPQTGKIQYAGEPVWPRIRVEADSFRNAQSALMLRATAVMEALEQRTKSS